MDFKYLNENANQNCLMRSVYRLIIIQDTWAMGYGLWAMGYGLCIAQCGSHQYTYVHIACGQKGRMKDLSF